ncbi:hypothetical protein JVU11DRAFT_1814 [Chiua virens]|nr:hypothetical protein JVU11DRAFT_1814 [Chiua virens]
MDAPRGFHHRFLNKRQGLGGVFSNLFNPVGASSNAVGGGQTTPASSQPTSADSGGGGSIVSGITSLIGNIPTATVPSSGTSSAATPTVSSTRPTSSAGSTSSASSTSTRLTTSSSTTSATSATDTPGSTPTQSPASDVVFTSSEGASVVYITSTVPVASQTVAPHTAFLQNPSMESGVFTLVGIVVLAIICVVVTWIMRKRRRARLEHDLAVAVSFDPGATERYERQEDMLEKRRFSGTSSGHGHGYGYGIQPAYAPPQEYHGPMGYGQYPASAYRPPSPRPLPYQTSPLAVPQPAAQGGTNLTRKFSDRKPVPAHLPDPAYDPTYAHSSVPPQFYQ